MFIESRFAHSAVSIFQNVETFNVHKTSKHDGGPEQCFVCKGEFVDPDKLLHHYRFHKSVKTYRCSVPNCTEAFMTKVEAISHLRNCEFSTGESASGPSSPATNKKRKLSGVGEEESTTDDSNLSSVEEEKDKAAGKGPSTDPATDSGNEEVSA